MITPTGNAEAASNADDADTPAVGQRVREFRVIRGYSVRQLARESALSASFISQLENGQTAPSVRSLLRICSVLAVNLSDLLPAAPGEDRAVLKSVERPLIQDLDGFRKFLLTRRPIRHLEVYQLELDPGADMGPAEAYGDTQALLLVTHGKATFQIGTDEELLNKDDSIEFRTSIPHTLVNIGPSQLTAVIVLKADIAGTRPAS